MDYLLTWWWTTHAKQGANDKVVVGQIRPLPGFRKISHQLSFDGQVLPSRLS